MNGSLLLAVILSLVAVPMWCLGLRMISDFTDAGHFQQSSGLWDKKIQDRKLLWRVRAYLLEYWPMAGKPILTCVACMPSLHTLPVMLFVWWVLRLPITFDLLICIPFIAVCSSFTAGYYWKRHGRQ
jgi:hypothetical protein